VHRAEVRDGVGPACGPWVVPRAGHFLQWEWAELLVKTLTMFVHHSNQCSARMRGLTTTEKGALAELALAHHAARQGIVALRPVVEGRRYDLVLDFGDRLWRVQCKWGALRGAVVIVHTGTCRHTPHGYLRTTYTLDEIDALGVYCGDLDRCYLLPVAAVSGKNYVHLRLTPARNNQKALVTMACDYELGAIAQLGERRHGMAEVVGSSPTSST